jgi:hypothetical protein
MVGLAAWALILSLYSLPVAYACELLLGIPAWVIFRRYNVSFR